MNRAMSAVSFSLLGAAVAMLCSAAAGAGAQQARVVKNPVAQKAGGYYLHNRAPLTPSQFLKLPAGSVNPHGWLRKQLELDASGIVGQMPQISDYIFHKNNGWVDPKGTEGWEELTYWLRGYGDLGYVLKDPKIIASATQWMDEVIKSQREDGWFGPDGARTSLDGGPDMWPHMPMLNALRSYYEYSGDKRVIPFLMKFFKYQDTLPAATYKRGWGAVRWGDNLDTVYWLYNHTGESWLLGLATKMHVNSADYTNGIPTWHNVNLAQGIREPAEYWQQAQDDKFKAATYRDYDTVMGLYGQFPGGGFAGDENCRPGYGDPRQGFETCGWVEYMHTFEMMTRITGDPTWSDRCEEIAFNSYPASLDPDHRGTHYITSANSISLKNDVKQHAQFQNGFPMQAFMPGIHQYRCCPHNLGMGWPYYAEELWLGTADNGLCASLYAASDVRAKVGEGTEVTVTEQTDYPFSDTISLKLAAAKAVKFPLYLRIPGWCVSASVKVNGKAVAVKPEPLSYVVLDRTWAPGDTVTLRLPMKLGVRTWTKNKNAVSVDYGPLTFSVDIKEKWSQVKGPDKWPTYEVEPESPWNYGLVLNAANPVAAMKLVRKPGPISNLPFTRDSVPLSLTVPAKRIPAWTADQDDVVGLLQKSPVASSEPTETITMIPMGAARLRITSLPTIGEGAEAHVWTAEPIEWPKMTASHQFDSLRAIVDGQDPASSYDQAKARFTWWDHKGTSEWVAMEFEKPQTVKAISLYWYDDTGHGECRVPQSWRLLYRDGGEWKPVSNASGYGVAANQYNRVTFTPVAANALRVEVQLRPGVSGGILATKVE